MKHIQIDRPDFLDKECYIRKENMFRFRLNFFPLKFDAPTDYVTKASVNVICTLKTNYLNGNCDF